MQTAGRSGARRYAKKRPFSRHSASDGLAVISGRRTIRLLATTRRRHRQPAGSDQQTPRDCDGRPYVGLWLRSPGPACGGLTHDSSPLGRVDWLLNFVDYDLFCAYGGAHLAQDEMQVADYPALASLRHAQLDAVIKPRSVEDVIASGTTPSRPSRSCNPSASDSVAGGS